MRQAESAQASLAFDELNMGEGVVGPPNISMRTTQLYSCTGVAMVNTARQRGGLYHYPANSLRNPNVTGTLLSMARHVQPDRIALTPAAPMMGMPATSDPDVDSLAQVLSRMAPNAQVQKTEPATFARLSWEDDKPFFGGYDHGDGEETAPPDRYRGTMTTLPRQLPGGALYFGGNGEIEGVLDQGIGPQRGR